MATIETPRMLLRPWEDDDVDPWVRMSTDEQVTRFFMRGSREREEYETRAAQLRASLERDGFGWWVAEIKGGPRFAGVIVLQEVPIDAPFTPAKEVGWVLSPEVWGHGYATEGARAALDFAFDTLGWNEVVAMTAALNLPSQRVMERLGMTRDPADDFDHPHGLEDHPLRPHVLYRIRR